MRQVQGDTDRDLWTSVRQGECGRLHGDLRQMALVLKAMEELTDSLGLKRLVR